MDGTGRYVRIGEESAVYLMELSLLDPMMRLAYQGLGRQRGLTKFGHVR